MLSHAGGSRHTRRHRRTRTVDPDGRPRPDIDVDVLAVGIQPASKRRAGGLEPTAGIEERAGGDALD